MPFWNQISRLIHEPPPDLVFEISEEGIAEFLGEFLQKFIHLDELGTRDWSAARVAAPALRRFVKKSSRRPRPQQFLR